MTRPDGPHVVKLAREAGRRESRYAQLFTGPPTQQLAGSAAEAVVSSGDESELVARVAVLEAAVRDLQRQLAELQEK